MRKILMFALALLFSTGAFSAMVGGAVDHPHKGVWYFANTWDRNCNGTKLDPELLRSWLASKRLDDIANTIRNPRVIAHCSAGVAGLEADSKDGKYLASETDYFTCAVAINGGRFLERYRLYADKVVCKDAITRIPPGN